MTTRARRDGRIFLLLSSTLFMLASLAMALSPKANVVDFKAVYFAARCVIQNVNPYDEQEFVKVYQADGGYSSEGTPKQRKVVTTYINLPTGLVVFAPFAMMPWGVAHIVWTTLIAILMTWAAWLIWGQVADAAPILAAILLSIFLLTSVVLVDVGNTAGLIVALIAIAVCLFLQDRLIPIAVICLAVSLLIKPHDAGFIWLFFLLNTGVFRKRAVLTLLLAIAIGLPGMVWMSRVAPHWPTDLRRNLVATSARGDINDPGPESASAHSADFIIDLQSVLSIVRDEPDFYNPVSVLLVVPLIVWWIVMVVRTKDGGARAWLALASISVITLLPVYHRQDDARMMLLSIPACVLVWKYHGRTGTIGLLLTVTALLLNGDTPTVLRQYLARPLLSSIEGSIGKLATILLDRPVPLVLLAMGIFYLVIYSSQAPLFAPAQQDGGQ